MPSRPHSWVGYQEDAKFDPAELPASGRNSPNEQQPMLNGYSEGVQPMRPIYDDNIGASSSSFGLAPSYSRRISSGSMPSSESSRSSPESGPSHSRTPLRVASHRSIASSPLNPSPYNHPQPYIHSPFARPGGQGSAQVLRIPSEESRAFSNGTLPLNSRASRGSMILYRKADTQDELLPPSVPYADNRNSMLSIDSGVSISSDSKYPVGSMKSEHGLIAYAWDPLDDEDEPSDEDDKLHDPLGKMPHDSGRAMSPRGIVNFTALILLLSGLLSLFVVYPVFSFFRDDGRNARIVGNTRINSTGQAFSVEFDQRSQIPITSLSTSIDPATPQNALTHTSKNGISYDLVFSDEFNVDGRSFSKGNDLIWEAIRDDDSRLVSTFNGSLFLGARDMPLGSSYKRPYSGGFLRQRTGVCVQEGFVEISVASLSSLTEDRLIWTGSWASIEKAQMSGTSLLETASLQVYFDPESTNKLAVDYVRFYQKTGASPASCTDDTPLEQVIYFGESFS